MAMREPMHLGEVDPVSNSSDTPSRLRLSKKPKNRKRKVKSKREIELSLLTPRMKDLAEGRISVDDLDTEELLRGQLRDSRGGFSGGRPAVLPREWHDAVRARIIQDAESMFRKNFDATMTVLAQMALNPATPARERLAASQYIIERVIGKIPEKQEIKTELSIFDKAVAQGEFLVDLGEQESSDVVDDAETENDPHHPFGRPDGA